MTEWFKNNRQGTIDLMQTLALIVTLVASFKFLMEGVSFTVMGNPISFGHADAATYAALLTPVLGVHGIREYFGKKKVKKEKPNVNDKSL